MKISLDLRRARQLVGVDQDVDRVLQARIVHIAEADLGELRMVHLVLDGGVETLQLDVHLDQRLALEHRRDGRLRVVDRVDDGLVDRAQEALRPPSGFP